MDIAIQKFSTVGLAPTFTAATAGGDTYLNRGPIYLFVKNGGASPVTVTINSLEQCNQGFDHDTVVSVAAGATSQLGPFAPGRYNDTDDKVWVNYSTATAVTVAAVQV